MKKAILFLFLFCTALAGSFAGPATGEPAPSFSLPDTNGKTHTLADLKGKYVVLEWVNYGCPFIRKHYDSGNMQSLQKEFTNKGVVWFSVCSSAPGKQGNMTPAEWNAAIKEKNASPTAVLLDPDGRVGHAYEAKTTPDMFVINPEGILIYSGAIDSMASTDQSDIATATNYVKAALNAAMIGKPVATPVTKSYGCGVKY